jgi:hypothetical protein
MLISSYVFQMDKFKEDPKNIPIIMEILKVVIIDLISGYSSSNTKLRMQAEDVFSRIFDLLTSQKSLPQLFQLLLVGFAGTKTQTKSATIRSLMLVLRLNYKKKGIDTNEPQFQEFLRKVSKIVALYLKDGTAEAEIHRASLKFLKTAISFLSEENLKGGDVLDSILAHGIFALPDYKRTKHLAIIRKLLGKLLKKLGPSYVKKATPTKHVPLIDYIERARRKRINKANRLKLLALLGKDTEETKSPSAGKKVEEDDSEDELESADEEEHEVEEHFSDDSDDSSSGDDDSDAEDAKAGGDTLMTDTLDIPRVDNIPVVSRLVKEKKIENSGRSRQIQLAESKERVKQLMAQDDEEYESHFVENPFIRMRERATSNGKTRLGAAQLRAGAALDGDADMMDEESAKKEDIILVKESGKFMINDLELLQMQSKQAGKKRMRIETAKESDDDESSVGDNASEGSSDTDEEDMKKKMRNATKRQKTTEHGNFKSKDQYQQ